MQIFCEDFLSSAFNPLPLAIGLFNIHTEKPKQITRMIKATTRFIVRVGQILRSAYKTAKGCTNAYCPLLDLYVSVDRCPAITI